MAGSLLAVTTVYAFYAYGLGDLHLGKETVLDLSKRDELSGEVSEKDILKKEVDIITLGGIAGSPEYSACNEWKAFLDEYDTDGAISSEIGNGFAGLGEYELIYHCYTQDMADKLDEICEKFELSRLHGLTIVEDYTALCRQAGIGDICTGNDGTVKWDYGGGILYDDGTFRMDGKVAWKGSSLLCVTDYQFERTMKGSFNPVTLNVGEVEEYHEWDYVAGSGRVVRLVNSSFKALIIAERDNSYIVVNVLGDLQGDTEETTEEEEVSGTEWETMQQESGAFLKLTDSPEYQACAEWWDFCAGYDTDFAILEQMEEEELEAENEYEAYNCYTPEMEQKVDEICEKYSLSKLSAFQIVDDYSELCNKAEVGDFCVRASENVKQTVLSSYLYDGAFLMEGNAVLAGSSMYEASYQFSRIEKGYFTSAYLDFGDISQCSVREYTTKKGENVLFANITNKERGTHTYIIAEREESFIVINVLGDMGIFTKRFYLKYSKDVV